MKVVSTIVTLRRCWCFSKPCAWLHQQLKDVRKACSRLVIFSKVVSTLVTILFSCATLFGQSKEKTKPLIIRGQIKDCTEKYLDVFFVDKHGQLLVDTLRLDDKGNFYWKTYTIKEPQRVRIKKNKIIIRNLFVAPGYNLTISGEVDNSLSLDQNIQISGIGSESNRYYYLLDSIQAARQTISWLDLKEADLLPYIENDQQLKDSLAHVVFDKTPIQDPYLKYFGSLVRMDNLFNRLYMLIMYVDWNNYNYDKSLSFVRTNFDNKILDNLYKDDYLRSYNYRTWIVGGQWVDYLLHLDYKKDSSLRHQKDYPLKKISETYRGKVREFALFDQLEDRISYIKSFAELNDVIAQFDTYGVSLKNPHYKKTLEAKLAEKKTVLLQAQVGKPAPSFSLQSNLGTTHSLDDFKNKVVYLDLWASWCTPCRAETPSLRLLYNKYKNDNRIAIIGISVLDGESRWRKAITEDKPEWLQLIDKDGCVVKSYAAGLIPRFIVIDKQGKIVNFDAPTPSSGKEIERLLEAEIAK